ncbi:DUF423 domain-containing protein [Alteromonas oceanisediminis]|uniref:DUF423 domain-containing protein n=1 Tax=Alteromonas oceanisediminis TaxID=2836180 RepID=UPI001BD92A71|nr:DUF423 domain-containing protein [Alteromonas oceanisediminis]MBT0587315.1 DUF423 domain-containing protein [Alteromonas oceanisediminis]
MYIKQVKWVGVTAALLAMFAVAMGAFAAHGLKAILSEPQLATLRTAVLYQFIHSLGALIAIGLSALAPLTAFRPSLVAASWLFIAGVLLFSGSLFGLVLFEARFLGPVTPIGGVCFLLGWGVLVSVFARVGGQSDKKENVQ